LQNKQKFFCVSLFEAARSPGFTVDFPTPSTSDLSSSSSCSRSPSPLTGIASISFDLSEATSEATSYDGETTSKDIFEQDSLESYSNSLASSSSSSASSLSLSLASSSSPLISDSALVQEIRQISSNEKEDHGIGSASSNSPEENTNNSVNSVFCGDR
jgi:hypothetical protein